MSQGKVLISADAYKVIPIGVCNCGSGGSSSTTIIEKPQINMGGLTEEQRRDLLRQLENWINKEVSIANDTMRNQLSGAVQAMQEAKKKLEAATDLAKAILERDDLSIITDDQALASAIEKINAKFGAIGAEMNTLKEAYADADQAVSKKIEEFKATLPNDPSITNLITEKTENIARRVGDQVNTIQGHIRTITNNVNELNSKIDEYSTIQSNGDKVVAGAGNVLTRGTGGEVGWKYYDTSGKKWKDASSTFEIKADNFRISDPSGTFIPFQIKDGQIWLGSNVNFDVEKQLNTIVGIERVESSPHQRTFVMGEKFAKDNNAVIYWQTTDGSNKSGFDFIGQASNGGMVNVPYTLQANSSAVVFYFNRAKQLIVTHTAAAGYGRYT